MIHTLKPPPAPADSMDPILEILNDADLTMGEKLLRMQALCVHDSTPEPQLGRNFGQSSPSPLYARVRGGHARTATG